MATEANHVAAEGEGGALADGVVDVPPEEAVVAAPEGVAVAAPPEGVVVAVPEAVTVAGPPEGGTDAVVFTGGTGSA